MTTLEGWYPDPHDMRQLRYWNGSAWTTATTFSHVSSPVPTAVDVRFTPPAPASTDGYSIAAMCLGAIALFIFPILFGPIAIVLAGVAMSKREGRAALAMGIAVGGTALGMVFGAIVGAALW